MKNFEIRIHGDSIEEIRGKLKEACEQFGVAADVVSAPLENEPAAATEPKRGRGRPPGASKGRPSPYTQKPEAAQTANAEEAAGEETPTEPAAIQTPAPVAEQKTATRDEAHAALQDVLARKDMQAVLSVLKEFGASKFSQVKEEDYGRFVSACSKAAA